MRTQGHPHEFTDRFLDQDKHPEWNGERTKMVYAFPTNEALWKQYAEIRARCLRDKGTIEDATAFYVAHRQEMDAGAVVAWPERFYEDEVSALQNAMNRKLDNEAAFFAECQNDPLPERQADLADLTPDDIMQRVNGLERGLLPRKASHLTAFIDVQQAALFYLVAAWADDFTGYVVDYGTYPDQRQAYFTLRDVHRPYVTLTARIAPLQTGPTGPASAAKPAVRLA